MLEVLVIVGDAQVSRANRDAAFRAVARHYDLSAGAKLLLLKIGDLVADGGVLAASAGYLADSLGEARSSVQRWTEELVGAGLLLRIEAGRRGQGRTSTFELRWCPLGAQKPGVKCPLSAHLVPTVSGIPLEEPQNHAGTSNPEPKNPQPSLDDSDFETFSTAKAEAILRAKVAAGDKVQNPPAFLAAVKANHRDEWHEEWEHQKENRALAAAIASCTEPGCSDGWVWTDEDTRSRCRCRITFETQHRAEQKEHAIAAL